MQLTTTVATVLLATPILAQAQILDRSLYSDPLYIRDLDAAYQNALTRRAPAPIEIELKFSGGNTVKIDVYGAIAGGCGILALGWCIKQAGVTRIRNAIRGVSTQTIQTALTTGLAGRFGGEPAAEAAAVELQNQGSRSPGGSGRNSPNPRRKRSIEAWPADDEADFWIRGLTEDDIYVY